MAAVEILEHRIERELERRVDPRLNLAQNQPALGLHGLRREARMERDLGDETEQRLPMSGERRSLDLRILDIARGVDAPADLLRSRRELHRGSAGAATPERESTPLTTRHSPNTH